MKVASPLIVKTILCKMFLRVELRALGISKEQEAEADIPSCFICADMGSEFRDRNLISVVLTQAWRLCKGFGYSTDCGPKRISLFSAQPRKSGLVRLFSNLFSEENEYPHSGPEP